MTLARRLPFVFALGSRRLTWRERLQDGTGAVCAGLVGGGCAAYLLDDFLGPAGLGGLLVAEAAVVCLVAIGRSDWIWSERYSGRLGCVCTSALSPHQILVGLVFSAPFSGIVVVAILAALVVLHAARAALDPVAVVSGQVALGAGYVLLSLGSIIRVTGRSIPVWSVTCWLTLPAVLVAAVVALHLGEVAVAIGNATAGGRFEAVAGAAVHLGAVPVAARVAAGLALCAIAVAVWVYTARSLRSRPPWPEPRMELTSGAPGRLDGHRAPHTRRRALPLLWTLRTAGGTPRDWTEFVAGTVPVLVICILVISGTRGVVDFRLAHAGVIVVEICLLFSAVARTNERLRWDFPHTMAPLALCAFRPLHLALGYVLGPAFWFWLGAVAVGGASVVLGAAGGFAPEACYQQAVIFIALAAGGAISQLFLWQTWSSVRYRGTVGMFALVICVEVLIAINWGPELDAVLPWWGTDPLRAGPRPGWDRVIALAILAAVLLAVVFALAVERFRWRKGEAAHPVLLAGWPVAAALVPFATGTPPSPSRCGVVAGLGLIAAVAMLPVAVRSGHSPTDRRSALRWPVLGAGVAAAVAAASLGDASATSVVLGAAFVAAVVVRLWAYGRLALAAGNVQPERAFPVSVGAFVFVEWLLLIVVSLVAERNAFASVSTITLSDKAYWASADLESVRLAVPCAVHIGFSVLLAGAAPLGRRVAAWTAKED